MPAKLVTAYVSIGSNIGDKEKNLISALKSLGSMPGTKLVAASALYCSAPVGFLAQDDFLNAVVQVETSLGPVELLHGLQQIEEKMGRVRTLRWGPRVIDLDIILYDEANIDLPELQIPHPRMTERAFVLVPLAELQPEMLISSIPIAALVKETLAQKIFLFKQKWFDTLDLTGSI